MLAWLIAAAHPAATLPAQTVREVVPPDVSQVAVGGNLDTHVHAYVNQATNSSALPARTNVTASVDFGNELALADVIASVYRSYPLILQARLEQSRTRGEVTGAYGAYDTKAAAYSISEPTGFYRNFRHGVGLARQTWWGGYVSAGYRVGRGMFQPWYQERSTNESGEFKVGFEQPLLQGRAIDPQRVAAFQASIANRAALPQIQESILTASRDAAAVYWEWLAAGVKLEAQREMLNLAEVRAGQLAAGFRAGKFPEIDLIFNQQLIAERRGSLLEAEQKYRTVGFKLALYLRDEAGQRMIPSDAWLPATFPQIEALPQQDFDTDLAQAIARRPEPQLLRLEVSRLQQDRRLASNQMLPQIDLVAEGSQDLGTPTSSKNDKGQFELVVGLSSEVPIQRRKARGKLQATSAKIAQLNQKLRLQIDKIATELITAYAALNYSAQIVEQERIALLASLETLKRYRSAFELGKTDLIYVNLLESKTNQDQLKLIEAQRSWFSALADMQRALGLDPLEQAMIVSRLASSQLPDAENVAAPNAP